MQQPKVEVEQELSRLSDEYSRRDSNAAFTNLYSRFNESALLHAQSLERNLLTLLKQHNFTNLAEKKILDVGCGTGDQLRRFLEYGALPTNLFGIDLMEHRIEQAQHLHPAINWKIGSAHQLPYPDATFDLVMSFVVFSSITCESLQQGIADEMWRVCKTDGLILFYDFAYSNPGNSAVRGITSRQIRKLFNRSGVSFVCRHIILAPPIARTVAPRAYWLAYMLEQLRILNTHIICLIVKYN